jgi:hypothetical protein
MMEPVIHPAGTLQQTVQQQLRPTAKEILRPNVPTDWVRFSGSASQPPTPSEDEAQQMQAIYQAFLDKDFEAFNTLKASYVEAHPKSFSSHAASPDAFVLQLPHPDFLVGTDLNPMDLSHVRFTTANGQPVNLQGQSFSGKDLSLFDTANCNLRGVQYDQNTFLPVTLDPDDVGMVLSITTGETPSFLPENTAQPDAATTPPGQPKSLEEEVEDLMREADEIIKNLPQSSTPPPSNNDSDSDVTLGDALDELADTASELADKAKSAAQKALKALKEGLGW